MKTGIMSKHKRRYVIDCEIWFAKGKLSLHVIIAVFNIGEEKISTFLLYDRFPLHALGSIKVPKNGDV